MYPKITRNTTTIRYFDSPKKSQTIFFFSFLFNFLFTERERQNKKKYLMINYLSLIPIQAKQKTKKQSLVINQKNTIKKNMQEIILWGNTKHTGYDRLVGRVNYKIKNTRSTIQYERENNTHIVHTERAVEWAHMVLNHKGIWIVHEGGRDMSRGSHFREELIITHVWLGSEMRKRNRARNVLNFSFLFVFFFNVFGFFLV